MPPETRALLKRRTLKSNYSIFFHEEMFVFKEQEMTRVEKTCVWQQ
jgi:hypothetical protein